jgi:hypothetical protein
MKKLVKVIAVVVATLFLLASCNKYVCPAYSDAKEEADTEQNA